jgi:hypothetical protein
VSGSAFDVVGNYYPVDIPLQYRWWLYNDDILKKIKQTGSARYSRSRFPEFFTTFCLSVCGQDAGSLFSSLIFQTRFSIKINFMHGIQFLKMKAKIDLKNSK